MSSFKNFGLDSWLLDTLDTLKIHTPTEVQVACIPPILQGKNVIGTAKTGSGKTAAFALPILQLLSKDPYGPFALILTPTRELALQIGDQFKAFGVGIGAREAVIVGGMDFIAQSVALSKRPHIIVATPGRLADLLESSSTKFFLKLIRFLVLDEVDRLLHASFSKDLDTIFQYLPEERQTLIYSATTNAQVNALIHTSANEAKMFIYQGECEVRTPDQLRQQYMLVPSPVKEAYLLHLLQTQFKDASMIIFTNRCRICALLYVFLQKFDISCIALHSFMTQKERMQALTRFKSSTLRVLLATDVGARGLDIPKVQLVINFDVPSSAVDYTHRVGRTARAGREGIALSLVTERDIQRLLHIENHVKKHFEGMEVNESEIQKGEFLRSVQIAKREAMFRLEETGFGTKKELNRIKKRKIEALQEEIELEDAVDSASV